MPNGADFCSLFSSKKRYIYDEMEINGVSIFVFLFCAEADSMTQNVVNYARI